MTASERIREARETAAPSESWSARNLMLMSAAGTADARGYRQWLAVGRQVRKGTKAFHILIPRTRKDENDKPVVCGFKSVPVFRFEDTDPVESSV